MDIDPQDLLEKAKDARISRLNSAVAITVALLATFTGICKVKDDNIVQAMQQAQADRIDHWSWYQSLHLREEVETGRIEQLVLTQETIAPEQKATFDKPIAEAKAKLEHLKQHKEEVAAQSKADQDTYDKLNYRDDQFDLSDAMVALAISLLAVTSLVQKNWLFRIALIPSVLGLLMGVAGLMGLPIHPDFIIKFLS